MTKTQKKRTRELLRLYTAATAGGAELDRRTADAVEEALEQVRRDDTLKAQLLQLRYIEGRSVRETVQALYIGEGGTTYHKMDLEALSTVAVVLAERGLKISE